MKRNPKSLLVEVPFKNAPELQFAMIFTLFFLNHSYSPLSEEQIKEVSTDEIHLN